jgi:hypothetical protein
MGMGGPHAATEGGAGIGGSSRSFWIFRPLPRLAPPQSVEAKKPPRRDFCRPGGAAPQIPSLTLRACMRRRCSTADPIAYAPGLYETAVQHRRPHRSPGNWPCGRLGSSRREPVTLTAGSATQRPWHPRPARDYGCDAWKIISAYPLPYQPGIACCSSTIRP